MRSWRAKAGILFLTVVVVLVVAGCADDTESGATDRGTPAVPTESGESPPGRESVPFALLDRPGWTLEEAVDLPPDHAFADIEPVPTDWYAEWNRLELTADLTIDERVKLTGIVGGIDSYRSSMETVGMSFEQVDTSAGSGVAGVTVKQEARPIVVVAVPFGTGTMELLSYDLSSAELIDLVDDIRMVDESEWRAAGGQSDS